MKMKLLISVSFVTIIILRLLFEIGLVNSIILTFIPPFFFLALTKDKADFIRLQICFLSMLTIVPLYIAILLLLISLLMNDEWMRSVRNWKLIVFTGIDGSGKTSHSVTTAEFIRKHGFNCTYYHIFKHPILSALSVFFAKIRGKPIQRSGDYHEVVYTKEFRRKIRKSLAIVRPLAQYIDNWLYIGSKLFYNWIRGRWVICDRYFYDYYIRFKCLGYPVPKFLEKLVFSFTPKPHLLIVLDVDPKISYTTRKHEHPYWYYVLARKEYYKIAKLFNAPIVNTERDYDMVQEILNEIMLRILLKRKK